jgi:protein involved in polysaccharide export with SLBB domain
MRLHLFAVWVIERSCRCWQLHPNQDLSSPMNNEFEEVTAVPRARGSFEHTQGEKQEQSSKKASSNGHYARNGHSDPGSKRQSRAEDSRRDRERRAERRESRSWRENEREPRRALPYYGPDVAEDDGFKFPFDPLRFVAALRRNWSWLAVTACVLAMAGLIAGAFLVKYKVSLHLIRRQSLNALASGQTDPLAPREYSDQMLYSFMKSGDVLKRVAAAAATNAVTAPLRLTPGDLAKRISIKPSPIPDLVTISVAGLGNIKGMVEVANLYAAEVVRYTQEIQRMEAAEVHSYLEKKLTEQDEKIKLASSHLRNFSTGVLDFDKEIDRDLKRLDDLQTRAEKSKIEWEIVSAQLKSGEEDAGTSNPTSPIAQAEQKLWELTNVKGYGERHAEVVQQRALIEKLKKAQANGEVLPMASPTTMANNPMVQRTIELKARKAAAEKELSQLTNLIASVTTKLQKSAETDQGISFAMAKNQLASLNTTRQALQQKFEQTLAYTENAMGYFRIYAPANAGSVDFAKRWMKVGILGLMGGLFGLVLAAAGVMLVEAMDTQLKTREDVERITNLPVLATLGDLRKMSPASQVNWAFRTLTLLKGKLSMDPNQALVCGIISSGHGEGRSTWVNLLVSAASQRGLRVLTVDTRPTSVAPAASVHKDKKKEEEKVNTAAASAQAFSAQESRGDAGAETGEELPVQQSPDTTLTTNVLSMPATVAEQLTDPNSQPVVHIPLPGWVWNLERRKQWKDALEHWRKIDNLVIFVELPPASQPESVLLSEHLPQLLWLVGSGMADAADTTEQLSTLRHARCNLVGALLNQAPPPVFNARIARWFTRATSLIAISATLVSTHAQKGGQTEAHRRAVAVTRANVAADGPHQEPAAVNALSEELPAQNDAGLSAAVQQTEEVRATDIPEPSENAGAAAAQEAGGAAQAEDLTFSGGVRKRKAKWQEKLTLGAGDVFDIHFYGNNALSRTNIFVGPDGTISYLQVQGLKAEGLSIEELRARLDEELAPYYTAPRTILIPVSFTSKRYYMLGKVAGKGMYVMDRPITVVEAVARAKGLETGLYQRNSVEMADLTRSFIVRDGEKLNVNLEKLFLDGDLGQNVVLEPNDYVYFESAAVNDIYVLGEVINPGPLGFVPNATVITAITDRGGYTERAYKRKVLVVRGSLNQPDTFVVDTAGILDARNSDFRLQARDIVYVSRRPWSKAEELLDEAAQSFIQGAVTAWAGVNAGPIIKQKLLPTIK